MFESIKESISSTVDSISEVITSAKETAEEVVDSIAQSVSEVSIFARETTPSEENCDKISFASDNQQFENYSSSVPAASNNLENITNTDRANVNNINSYDIPEKINSAVDFISDKIETAKDKVLTLFDIPKAEASKMPTQNLPPNLNQIISENETNTFNQDNRIKTDDVTGPYVRVEEWLSAPNANDCLEGIIENSYDLSKMGIEYGSDEYYNLQNKIMALNPEIFAQNGIESILYDNDKIRLPEYKIKQPIENQTNKYNSQDLFKASMLSALDYEERELISRIGSNGFIDSAKSFFGDGTAVQEKEYAEKKAAFEKYLKSNNDEDLLAAYKLINKNNQVYVNEQGKVVDINSIDKTEIPKCKSMTIGELSNEAISEIIKQETIKTEEAVRNAEIISSGTVECYGKTVSPKLITSILKQQSAEIRQNIQNATDRQGYISKAFGFGNNYLGVGTTKDNMEAQINLQNQLINELEKCTNPNEFAAKFKQVTGQDFDTIAISSLLAYDRMKNGGENNTPNYNDGKIDLTSGVNDIIKFVEQENNGNKNIIFPKQNLNLQNMINDYKSTQKMLKEDAIAIATFPITIMGAATAVPSNGLSLLASGGIGAALSTGVNILDSFYDANGDGSIDFNYSPTEFAKDALIGCGNGLFAGAASFARMRLINKISASSINPANQMLLINLLENKKILAMADTAKSDSVVSEI